MDLFIAFISGVFWLICVLVIIDRLGDIRDELRRLNARFTAKDKWGEPVE